MRVPGHPPLVFVQDVEGIREILATPERDLWPGRGAAAVCPIVGERSFMLAHGPHHAIPRNALLAALSARQVRRHAAMVEAVAQRTLEGWPIEQCVALHPRLRAMTLEVALRLLLGRFDETLDDETWELHAAILAMLSVTTSPVLTEPYLRGHGPGRRVWQRFLRDRSRVDAMLYELIERERSVERGSPAEGLLAMLVGLRNPDGSPSTATQARDNIMSLLLAGHETTAAQLAWAFQLLAHNSAPQARLAAEIDMGATDQYLNATVQEILRHRNVFVFAIPRELAKTVDLGGWSVAPPAQLLPCIYLLHHDPECFPDPGRFLPERFLGCAPDPRTWLPWGGGRRRCPGAHLATLEIRAVLRVVLRSRTVSAVSRMERPRWRSVIVSPRSGGRVVLRARESRASATRATRPGATRPGVHRAGAD